jgi:hypothetical protein
LTRLGERLQTRGYVDAISEDIVLFGDHVADASAFVARWSGPNCWFTIASVKIDA